MSQGKIEVVTQQTIQVKISDPPEVPVNVDVETLVNKIESDLLNRIIFPITFFKSVIGRKTTRGQVDRAFTFGKSVVGFVVNVSGGYGSATYSEGIYPGAVNTYQGVTSLPITFGKAVSGFKSNVTAVAEISLASHSTPSNRTNHSIKVRARTTSGSTGVLKAALYEGSTKRSGSVDLMTPPLTNSLADYTLNIPDSSAATITDYSNLSIRFWGYDPNGNALVFEVAKIYLQIPSA